MTLRQVGIDMMSETPVIIKFFTFISLCGCIGCLILGIIELINLSMMGLAYLIQAMYFFIIFIGLATAKKWSLMLLFILFVANFIYSLWININQTMTKYGYISLGIMVMILIIVIYLLTREDVKAYFSQSETGDK